MTKKEKKAINKRREEEKEIKEKEKELEEKKFKLEKKEQEEVRKREEEIAKIEEKIIEKSKEEKEEIEEGKDIFDFIQVKDVTTSGSSKYHSLDNLLTLSKAMQAKGWSKKAFEVKDFLRIAGYKKSYIQEEIEDPIEKIISCLKQEINNDIVKDYENHIGGRVAGLKRILSNKDDFKDINIGSNKKLVYIEVK